VLNRCVHAVGLEVCDNKVGCLIIEIDFASETVMILENKILTKTALLMVGDTSQDQVI
jgi:hypothetical protein